jgi:hypothetical protein
MICPKAPLKGSRNSTPRKGYSSLPVCTFDEYWAKLHFCGTPFLAHPPGFLCGRLSSCASHVPFTIGSKHLVPGSSHTPMQWVIGGNWFPGRIARLVGQVKSRPYTHNSSVTGARPRGLKKTAPRVPERPLDEIVSFLRCLGILSVEPR